MEQPPGIRSIEDLQQGLQHVKSGCRPTARPFILISYAQSLDGSIATLDRRPLKISGSASLMLTHRLRSLFDAILVGIDTVVADNPLLTVRLVPGVNPQPVVLDTHLRIPLESRLLERSDRRSWLAGVKDDASARTDAVSRAGAEILPCRLNDQGQIDIRHLMGLLFERGIRSLMVEGGARVISSFIRAELADLFIITISPTLIGGLRVIQGQNGCPPSRLTLTQIHYEDLENDLILWAEPAWNRP
ncbi:MAG: RibD family protein [Deltaproteobacteria bacterium]|nr:RibD family protein [Deltaproteobacteria bacterium]